MFSKRMALRCEGVDDLSVLMGVRMIIHFLLIMTLKTKPFFAQK